MSSTNNKKKAKAVGVSTSDLDKTTQMSRVQLLTTDPGLLPITLSSPPQPSDFFIDLTPQRLSSNDPIIIEIFESLHTLYNSKTSPDTCWHMRLKDEIFNALLVAECHLSDNTQDIGSPAFDLFQFYHAISNTFVNDFHRATDGLCNNLKPHKRVFDPLTFNYHQRSILTHIVFHWLSYLLSLLFKSGCESLQLGLKILLSQHFYFVAADSFQTVGHLRRWEKYLIRIQNGLMPTSAGRLPVCNLLYNAPISTPAPPSTTAITITTTSHYHNTVFDDANDDYKPDTGDDTLQNVQQFLQYPRLQQIGLCMEKCVGDLGKQLHQVITTSESQSNQCGSLLVLAWNCLPDNAKTDFLYTPIPQNPHHLAQYALRKYIERGEVCQHEALRRQLLLSLAMEDSLQQYLTIEPPKLKLSFLWDQITNPECFCPSKNKCPPISPNDPFVLYEQQYIAGIVYHIPIPERITLYRHAQHIVSSIISTTVSQAEMTRWVVDGMRKSRFIHECLLVIASKYIGEFPAPIRQAIESQEPYGYIGYFPSSDSAPIVLYGPEIPTTSSNMIHHTLFDQTKHYKKADSNRAKKNNTTNNNVIIINNDTINDNKNNINSNNDDDGDDDDDNDDNDDDDDDDDDDGGDDDDDASTTTPPATTTPATTVTAITTTPITPTNIPTINTSPSTSNNHNVNVVDSIKPGPTTSIEKIKINNTIDTTKSGATINIGSEKINPSVKTPKINNTATVATTSKSNKKNNNNKPSTTAIKKASQEPTKSHRSTRNQHQASLPPSNSSISPLPSITTTTTTTSSSGTNSGKTQGKHVVPHSTKRKLLPPPPVSSVPIQTFSNQLTIPSTLLNHKNHIIAPNQLDIGNITSLSTYFNGLSAIAGKYRTINPSDSIDQVLNYPTHNEQSPSTPVITTPKTTRMITHQLEDHDQQLSTINHALLHLLRNNDKLHHDVSLLKTMVYSLTCENVALHQQLDELTNPIPSNITPTIDTNITNNNTPAATKRPRAKSQEEEDFTSSSSSQDLDQ